MKKLEDITNDELLYIDMGKCVDPVITTKEDFLSDKYFKDKQFKLFTAQPMYAVFSLYNSLSNLEDDMYENWLSDVMNDIPKEFIDKVESKINKCLENNPTYYPKERVEW